MPKQGGEEELRELYRSRFGQEQASRDVLWKTLCDHFFQAWIPDDASVLDVAAGHCEFINNIRAGRRVALDLNPDVEEHASPGVEGIVGRSDDMTRIADQSIDRVFISNFFEHITREQILGTLDEVRRVLRPDGKLLVLQPNIRFCSRDYWMFFDHITPVDDRALVEALESRGFCVELNLPRFLPYSTKGSLPVRKSLVRAYLRFRPAWRVLGAQAFVVATP